MRLAMKICSGSRSGKAARLLTGKSRFLFYLVLQFGVFLLGGPYLILPGFLILILGLGEGFSWLAWAKSAWPVLLMASLPAVTGFPAAPVLQRLVSGASPSDPSLTDFLAVWTPSLIQSGRFLLVFASAAWLSRGQSPMELREVLTALLRPLGPRLGRGVARTAALALAFLPWTLAEIKKADEAARLRGSQPRRSPARHLAALAVPVSVRALEKARLSAEALELREAGTSSGV